MADQVRVRALRAFHLHGDVIPAGAVIKASPSDAAQVLESGRGELVHADDLPAVRQAAEGAVRAALREVSSGRLMSPAPDPWQRLGS